MRDWYKLVLDSVYAFIYVLFDKKKYAAHRTVSPPPLRARLGKVSFKFNVFKA